jgi:hypothetical protein
MKHRNAEAIHAWADGKAIQFRCLSNTNLEWKDYKQDNVVLLPAFNTYEWRVKPEPQRVTVVLARFPQGSISPVRKAFAEELGYKILSDPVEIEVKE